MVRAVVPMVTLEDMIVAYFSARRNKRRSRDSVHFEYCYEKNIVELVAEVNSRTLRVDSNYAFVVFSPHVREIFATSMSVRVIHHYLDWRLRPIYERVLSDRSFNNRKGLGLHRAIATYRNDIREVTENYTRDAWCIHLDLKGYFPNASVEIALKQQLGLIDKYYDGEDRDDLKYMMSSCLRADPARHCKVYVPKESWNVVAPEKSLFNKTVGTGAAIGFLCWQNAMALYINDVVKWLQGHGFLRIVVFVDDIYIVTSDKRKFLDLMPELRKRLADVMVRMNERKFYCQHFSKGLRCLGSRIRFGRERADRATVIRAFARMNELKKVRLEPERLLSVLNTYNGVFRNKDMADEYGKFRATALKMFGRWIVWNGARRCFGLKERFRFRERMRRWYRGVA